MTVNAFLRNIERIRDAEREQRLADTKGAELMKSHGGGPGRRGAEDAQAKRLRMARVRASVPEYTRAMIFESCRTGDFATAKKWIATLDSSQRADVRDRVLRRGFGWPT